MGKSIRKLYKVLCVYHDVTVEFKKRPFGFKVVPKHGRTVVYKLRRRNRPKGIQRNMMIKTIGDEDVSSMEHKEIIEKLEDETLPLPISITFCKFCHTGKEAILATTWLVFEGKSVKKCLSDSLKFTVLTA